MGENLFLIGNNPLRDEIETIFRPIKQIIAQRAAGNAGAPTATVAICVPQAHIVARHLAHQ